MKNISENDVKVIKRDGSIANWDPDKIYKYVKMACEGTKISPSDILMKLDIVLQKRMKTSDIQDTLIKSVSDDISVNNSENELVAARLLNQKLRKQVYDQFLPLDFYEEVQKRVKKKYYDSNILKMYSEEDFAKLCKYIDYSKDDLFTYTGLLQMSKKYLIRDKNDIPIETPQEVFMLIPMYMFANEKNRLVFIKNMYKELSELKLALSTPIISGVRTKLRMFSSCAGIQVPDSQTGIAKSFEDMYKLTLNRAGIGSNYGHIRGENALIDGGREKHTGLIPLLKVAEKISLSAMQPGTGRGGAITQYYPFFHWEIENILELKNNKGTDDNRVRQSDHAIIFNDLFYERLAEDGDISLFYMNDVGDLYDKIGYPEFKERYEALENRRGISKKTVKARDIYNKFWIERIATGRLYKVNANAFQEHSAFKVPVYNSNLCTEINLPSFMYEDFSILVKNGYRKAMHNLIEEMEVSGDWYSLYEHFWFNKELPDNELFQEYKNMLAKPRHIKANNIEEYKINFYEIFVCILAGINLGKMKNYEEIETNARILVRFLDNLIDYQDYPIDAMARGAEGRRALGISVSGLFHYLAKHDLDYKTEEARNEIHRVMESLYYGAITESIQLAKEKGTCKFYNDTKYSDGLLTLDTYERNVDELVSADYQYDWDKVRDDLEKYGIRNSTLLTMVPASNSARLVNTIAGIEPPQDLITIIEDKRMNARMALPEVNKYKDFYEKNNVWNIDTAEYYKLIAVMQKFIDQAISVNQYNSYLKYPDEKIPYSVLVKQDLTAKKYGIKTFYYSKTQSDDEGKKHIDKEESVCDGGGCEL